MHVREKADDTVELGVRAPDFQCSKLVVTLPVVTKTIRPEPNKGAHMQSPIAYGQGSGFAALFRHPRLSPTWSVWRRWCRRRGRT